MPAGRPKKELDYELIETLANIMCTQEEIASACKCSVDKLHSDEKFTEIYKRGRENGKMSLRRTQFKLAEKSYAMAIWLGKQYLGQRDNIDVVTTDMSKVDELLNEIKKKANID